MCDPIPFPCRKVCVPCICLGTRRVLEYHFDIINGHCLEIFFDDDIRGNYAGVTGCDIFPNGLINMAKWAAWQQYAVLKEQAP